MLVPGSGSPDDGAVIGGGESKACLACGEGSRRMFSSLSWGIAGGL